MLPCAVPEDAPRGLPRKDASDAMTILKHRLVRIGNRIGVWMYRAFDGRLANSDSRLN
jgi:hypothetical protein